jgi:hypothetical protein
MAVTEVVHHGSTNGIRTAQPGDLVLIENLETRTEQEVLMTVIPEREPGPAIKAILDRAEREVIEIPLKGRLVKHLIRKISTPSTKPLGTTER